MACFFSSCFGYCSGESAHSSKWREMSRFLSAPLGGVPNRSGVGGIEALLAAGLLLIAS